MRQIALIAYLGLMAACQATAQTFTTLYGFTGGGDGSDPQAGLVLSGSTLYGTTKESDGGFGTVYAVNTDGSGFTNLYNFTANIDGAYPTAGLLLSGNTLYGTASQNADYGAVYAVNTDGTNFTNLHSFTGGSDGADPYAGLILSGSTLYGAAGSGGDEGVGVVFAVNTNGTMFTNLFSFSYTNVSTRYSPYCNLILSGNTLYGTTSVAGTNGGYGTVFAVNTDGSDFRVLHTFTTPDGSVNVPGTNSDGATPFASLILSGHILYGTASTGGITGNGTVFAVNTDGTGFTNLYNFTRGSDGAFPVAGLVLSGNTLYGTASVGGNADYGTVFAINTDGTGFTSLYSFTGVSDGAYPKAGLILSGNTLYGTASQGGTSGAGTVFALSLVPSLGIALTGQQVVISWPTWAPNYGLQTTTNLASPVWIAVSPVPVVFNGQNVVTNSISAAQQFYRLSQASP